MQETARDILEELLMAGFIPEEFEDRAEAAIQRER